MSKELNVVVNPSLKRGEMRLEPSQDSFRLLVDSNDTLQALVLGLATLETGNQSHARQLTLSL